MWDQASMYYMGRDPRRKEEFGVVRPTEALGVSAAMYAVKEIIQSSITTRHAMKSFIKIL